MPLCASPVALDLDGKRKNPLETTNQTVVLIFLAVECPIANSYAPTYKRLAEEFKEARFIAIYPNPDESPEAIRKHLKDYSLPFEALRDTQHELVNATGAKVTPEAAVYASGKLVYMGRIDDRHVAFGKKRPAATQHDLRDALAALRDGKPLKRPAVGGIGCSIPPLP